MHAVLSIGMMGVVDKATITGIHKEHLLLKPNSRKAYKLTLTVATITA